MAVRTPSFATRRDARRFFVGTALFMVAVALFLVYIIVSIVEGVRIVETNWFWASEGAFLLVLLSAAIRTGPVRRATLPADKQRGFVNPFRRTGLYSREGLRDAFRVALGR